MQPTQKHQLEFARNTIHYEFVGALIGMIDGRQKGSTAPEYQSFTSRVHSEFWNQTIDNELIMACLVFERYFADGALHQRTWINEKRFCQTEFVHARLLCRYPGVNLTVKQVRQRLHGLRRRYLDSAGMGSRSSTSEVVDPYCVIRDPHLLVKEDPPEDRRPRGSVCAFIDAHVVLGLQQAVDVNVVNLLDDAITQNVVLRAEDGKEGLSQLNMIWASTSFLVGIPLATHTEVALFQDEETAPRFLARYAVVCTAICDRGFEYTVLCDAIRHLGTLEGDLSRYKVRQTFVGAGPIEVEVYQDVRFDFLVYYNFV